MFENQKFRRLVEDGNPSGEVVAVNRFVVNIRGLRGAPVGAVLLFENNDLGLVKAIDDTKVTVLNLSSERLPVGTLVVLLNPVMQVDVGKGLLGRVITPLVQSLDNKGPLQVSTPRAVFAEAPGIIQRSLLDQQLTTGVMVVDTLFPVVLGQRIAVLGDAKSGKSTFLTQLAINQKGQDRIVIFALIGKRKADVDRLIQKLSLAGVMEYCVIVVADTFAALPNAYLAPYVACAIGEYFWNEGKDAVVIYDDLTSHAKFYREMSLLTQVSPGRDSYPGDMFYAHSSLLERAGKLAKNNKSLTALPVVLTPGDDITAYLPTNVMSITDGQIIFDLESMREGVRPAVNVGLSVSRVGSRVQSKRQRKLVGTLLKKLADYRQAKEFAHFGSELAVETQADLELGKRIYDAFKQTPEEVYQLQEQQLILETILKSGGRTRIDISSLKTKIREMAGRKVDDADYLKLIDRLLATTTMEHTG